jgi:hypothetical protein
VIIDHDYLDKARVILRQERSDRITDHSRFVACWYNSDDPRLSSGGTCTRTPPDPPEASAARRQINPDSCGESRDRCSPHASTDERKKREGLFSNQFCGTLQHSGNVQAAGLE